MNRKVVKNICWKRYIGVFISEVLLHGVPAEYITCLNSQDLLLCRPIP